MAADHRIPDAAEPFLPRASVRPSWRSMAPGLIWGVFSGMSAVLLMGLSAYLITRAAEQPPILYLGLLVVGVRAFALSRAFFRYLERLSSHDAAFSVLGGLRSDAFARLEPLAPAQLGGSRRGDLLTRLVDDVDQLVDWPVRVIQPLVTSGTIIVLTVAALAYFSPAGALVLAAFLLVALLLGTVLQARLSDRAESATAGLRGRLADELVDLVANLEVLITFDAAEDQLRRVRQADRELRRASLRSALGVGLASAVPVAAAGLSVAALLALLMGQVVPGEPIGPGFRLEAGTVDGPLLAVFALVPLAVFELSAAVPLAWQARRRVLASLERMRTLAPESAAATRPCRPAEAAAPASSPELAGLEKAELEKTPDGRLAEVLQSPALVLRDFTVSWPGSSRPVSAAIDVELGAGETLLVTGPSGVGKTAFAYGLVGFLGHSGEYRLGPRSAAELSELELRRQVCLIEQDAHLFDSTLRANLALAHPSGPEAAADPELIQVLEAVGLWEWAQSRQGLDTQVGSEGALVSGGQAQRIAVARGLLSGAGLLVLDEPTAHVDPEMADALIRRLLRAADQRSVVVLSHLPIPDELVDRRLRLSSGPAASS